MYAINVKSVINIHTEEASYSMYSVNVKKVLKVYCDFVCPEGQTA